MAVNKYHIKYQTVRTCKNVLCKTSQVVLGLTHLPTPPVSYAMGNEVFFFFRGQRCSFMKVTTYMY